MDDRNFIRKYVKADSRQKVDIIFRHYSMPLVVSGIILILWESLMDIRKDSVI